MDSQQQSTTSSSGSGAAVEYPCVEIRGQNHWQLPEPYIIEEQRQQEEVPVDPVLQPGPQHVYTSSTHDERSDNNTLDLPVAVAVEVAVAALVLEDDSTEAVPPSSFPVAALHEEKALLLSALTMDAYDATTCSLSLLEESPAFPPPPEPASPTPSMTSMSDDEEEGEAEEEEYYDCHSVLYDHESNHCRQSNNHCHPTPTNGAGTSTNRVVAAMAG